MQNLFTKLIVTFVIFNSAYAGSHFNKVVYIVFENTSFNKTMENAIFKKYASKGTLFTNFFAETHPSQPNYIAMIAGNTRGVTNDDNVDLDGKHLGDLLESRNLTWKAYAENFPGNCFLGKNAGRYARKHVPFLSFKNVSMNSSRCLNIDDGKVFFNDLKNGSLPNFSIYVPDLSDDGHDTGVSVAATWFDKAFGLILNDPNKLNDILYVLTFDESARIPLQNQIYTVLIGANVRPGNTNGQLVNHVSLLRMIEDEFQLGSLGKEDLSATAINGVWK